MYDETFTTADTVEIVLNEQTVLTCINGFMVKINCFIANFVI